MKKYEFSVFYDLEFEDKYKYNCPVTIWVNENSSTLDKHIQLLSTIVAYHNANVQSNPNYYSITMDDLIIKSIVQW